MLIPRKNFLSHVRYLIYCVHSTTLLKSGWESLSIFTICIEIESLRHKRQKLQWFFNKVWIGHFINYWKIAFFLSIDRDPTAKINHSLLIRDRVCCHKTWTTHIKKIIWSAASTRQLDEHTQLIRVFKAFKYRTKISTLFRPSNDFRLWETLTSWKHGLAVASARQQQSVNVLMEEFLCGVILHARSARQRRNMIFYI